MARSVLLAFLFILVSAVTSLYVDQSDELQGDANLLVNSHALRLSRSRRQGPLGSWPVLPPAWTSATRPVPPPSSRPTTPRSTSSPTQRPTTPKPTTRPTRGPTRRPVPPHAYHPHPPHRPVPVGHPLPPPPVSGVPGGPTYPQRPPSPTVFRY